MLTSNCIAYLMFPVPEVTAQECSDRFGQNSGVVSNTYDWELDNSDDNWRPEVNWVNGMN